MNDLEKQIIYSAVLRLANEDEILSPAERRDVISELCRGLCDMSLDEILNKTKNNRKLRLKRGNTATNDAYTGLAGEITMDTDTGIVRVHDGETAGGVPMARAMDINGDWVVESQLPTAENNYTWYRKYKSGWIEQGGIATESNIVFPVVFSNVNYTVNCTPSMINENVGNISICYGIKTVSSIAIQIRWNGAGTTGKRCWYACGY